MKPRLGQWIDQQQLQQHDNDTAHVVHAVDIVRLFRMQMLLLLLVLLLLLLLFHNFHLCWRAANTYTLTYTHTNTHIMLWHGFGGNLHRLCCTWHNERNSLENSYYFHIIAFSEIVFMLLVVSISISIQELCISRPLYSLLSPFPGARFSFVLVFQFFFFFSFLIDCFLSFPVATKRKKST